LVYTARWRASGGRNVLERIGYPFAYLINRPGLHVFAKLLYDFALRCNGIGIAFPGQHGLTRSEENFLRRVAPSLKKATIFDVGANVGAYASLLKDLVPDCTIYAFEPHPTTFAKLQRVAEAKGFTAIQKAASDTTGFAQLYDFATQDGSTQASLDRETISFQDNAPTVRHDVASVRLDEFADEYQIQKIDLLKIDTEGLDLAVLKGAPRLLAERRVEMIQFEIIPANVVRRVAIKDFFELLDEYNLYRMCMNGQLLSLQPYSVKSCEIYLTQNLIAKFRR